MMFYLNSKTFQNYFLTNETDKNILKAQYVLVSTRIRKRNSLDNIVNAYVLFPDARVCSAVSNEELRERYFKQLDDNETLLASLVLGSIEEKYNIIFMCTKLEDKINFLKYLSEYIYLNFGYPVYEYKLYASGASRLLKYNKKKVIKKCRTLLKEAKNKDLTSKLSSAQGRERLKKEYKEKSKKELEKICKKMDVYEEGLSKSEMIEAIMDFL